MHPSWHTGFEPVVAAGLAGDGGCRVLRCASVARRDVSAVGEGRVDLRAFARVLVGQVLHKLHGVGLEALARELVPRRFAEPHLHVPAVVRGDDGAHGKHFARAELDDVRAGNEVRVVLGPVLRDAAHRTTVQAVRAVLLAPLLEGGRALPVRVRRHGVARRGVEDVAVRLCSACRRGEHRHRQAHAPRLASRHRRRLASVPCVRLRRLTRARAC